MRSSAKWIWIFLIVAFVGGFLFADAAGLVGVGQLTPTTPVATVNGEEILATTWFQATAALEQQATQQSSRSITLDERRRLSDEAFEQLVSDA
jgi:peptidyl-prolyl cis-trans isomerase D